MTNPVIEKQVRHTSDLVDRAHEDHHVRPMISPMRRMNKIHFVGIGGAGMCGIAEVLINQGYEVSGSDIHSNHTTTRLQELGAKVAIGHDAGNVLGVSVVVTSTAIESENVEVQAARQQGLPIVPRAEMLAELMRHRHGIAVAGTHGKTTTTSLLASVFAEAGTAPTFVIGGLLNAANANAQLGEGPYFIAEADESDASFLHLQPMSTVITNIEADHMETYAGDIQRLKNTFVEFVHNLPFYGIVVACIDDPVVRELKQQFHRVVYTYGFSDDAQYRIAEYQCDHLRSHFQVYAPGASNPVHISLNMPGRHNVLNATAAYALAREEGIASDEIIRALDHFQGVGRRFNVYTDRSIAGVSCTLVDDYGHHPSEISATLQAAREAWPDSRIVMVFQPHRFSRTRDLYEDFVQCLSTVDVLVLLNVYAAGEDEIAGADSRSLARSVRSRGVVDPVFIEEHAELYAVLSDVVLKDDVVIFQGAGDIGKLFGSLVSGKTAT